MILTTRLHLAPKCENEWLYTSTPLIRLHGVGKQNFNFLLTQWLRVSTFAWTERVIDWRGIRQSEMERRELMF